MWILLYWVCHERGLCRDNNNNKKKNEKKKERKKALTAKDICQGYTTHGRKRKKRYK